MKEMTITRNVAPADTPAYTHSILSPIYRAIEEAEIGEWTMVENIERASVANVRTYCYLQSKAGTYGKGIKVQVMAKKTEPGFSTVYIRKYKAVG